MAQKQGISQKVAVGDPGSPGHVLKPNADGSINVVNSDGSSDATAANQVIEIGLLGDIKDDLEEVVPYLPPIPAQPASDTTFSHGTINLTAVSGDQTLVAAVSGQSTRCHRFFGTFTGGVSESLVTVKQGATAIGYFRVPTTGLVIDRSVDSYWLWDKTANNAAFILSPSVAINIAGDFLYQTSA